MVERAPNRSVPVNRFNASAAALLKVLWPDTCSGKGGVGKVVDWKGIHDSPGIS